MNFNDLLKRQNCSCGKSHLTYTKVVRVGKGALSSMTRDLERITSVGGQIALIYENNSLEGAKRVENEVSRYGFRVQKFLPYEINLEKEEYFSALIGVGGARLCDFTRLLAKVYDKKVLLLPTSLFGCCKFESVCKEKEGFIIQKSSRSPDIAILDDNVFNLCPNSLASGFGEAVSRLFSVVDDKIICYLKGERVCDKIFSEVKEEVVSLISKLQSLDRRDKGTSQVIAQSCTALSLLDQRYEGRVYGGGEVCTSLCDEMLAKREGRKPNDFGENAFLYANSLLHLYLEGLDYCRKGFLAPPNNNRRLELISEYLGIDEVFGYKHQDELLDNDQLTLMQYRISRYHDEIVSDLNYIKEVFLEAQKIFYRLYPDDGFSVSGEREEGPLCVALAPDLSKRFTTLNYFKEVGILERFLY